MAKPTDDRLKSVEGLASYGDRMLLLCLNIHFTMLYIYKVHGNFCFKYARLVLQFQNQLSLGDIIIHIYRLIGYRNLQSINRLVGQTNRSSVIIDHRPITKNQHASISGKDTLMSSINEDQASL